MAELSEKEKNGAPEGFLQKLMQARTVMLTGEVDHEMAEKVIGQLVVLDNESKAPIKVVLTTPGGHVDSGLAIYDVMRYIESPVFTIGAGWVASIGVPILFGAPKQNRLALPHTRFMIHQPSGGAGGQLADLRIEAQEILKIRQIINQMIAEETGQPIEKVSRDSDRNFWMSASEALEYGLIARVITSAAEVK